MAKKTRVHMIISGRVQGVCFRAETQRAAQLYGVNGWVRNQPDGTVEAVAEGDAADVQSLINWCRKGLPVSRVDDVQVRWQDYEGAFETFKITY